LEHKGIELDGNVLLSGELGQDVENVGESAVTVAARMIVVAIFAVHDHYDLGVTRLDAEANPEHGGNNGNRKEAGEFHARVSSM
jgi:hypothetical protein